MVWIVGYFKIRRVIYEICEVFGSPDVTFKSIGVACRIFSWVLPSIECNKLVTDILLSLQHLVRCRLL